MAVSGQNTAEGITLDSVPTSGSSGGISGTAFSTISVGDSSTVLVTAAAKVHGTRGYEFNLAGNTTDGATRILWPMAESARLVFSFYVNMPTSISVFEDLGGIRSASGNMCVAQVGSDGKFVMADAGGNTLSASRAPNVFPSGITRVDISCAKGTSTANGTIGYAYYSANSSTPIYSWESSAVNTGTADIAYGVIGRSTGRAGARTLYYDTIRWATTTSGFFSNYVDPGGSSGTITQLGINTAEGIPLNTSLTTASASITGDASGTAASSINVGANSAILVTNFSPTHGSRGYFFDFAASTSDGSTRLLFPCVRSDRVVLSFYIGELTTLPNTTEDLCGIRYSSGNMCVLSIGSDNKLVMADAGGTISASKATDVFPTQTKLRVEIAAAKGTTTSDGTVGYSYYLAGSDTPIFTWESALANTGTANTATVFVGRSTGRAGATDLYVDTIRWGYGTTWFSDYVPPKTAPYGDLGGTINDIEPYSTVTVNCGNSIDIDGTIVSYNLTQVSGPTVTDLTGSGPTFTYTAPGSIDPATVVWQLIVTDNDGSDSAPITVDHNILPVNEMLLTGGVWIPIDVQRY